MRFQTTKIIQREDPQIVLHALELSLRQLSLDVVLDGSEIILHGLGPSPRTINHRDAAILRVDTEANRTIINADITFEPSCLLGESPQVEAVSYKLDCVFDQMSSEISFERRRKTQSIITTNAVPTFLHSDEAASPLRVVELVSAVPGTARHALLSEQEPTRTASSLCYVDYARPLAFHVMRWRTFMIAAPCVVSLFISLFMLRDRIHVDKSIDPNYAGQLTIAQRSILSPTVSPAAGVTDPREWLGSWVAAMRTRDPAVQTAFYADQVDNYLGQKNVLKASILAQKKAAIEHRNGLWTVKLEELVLVKESSTSVKVNLIKHFIAQKQSSKISEKFIRCHLHLRRISGSWRIISEEDFS